MEAMFFSLDPRETAGKTRPPLHIDGVPVGYTKHPVTLGITLDPQVTSTEHARLAKKRMSSRNNILRYLSGKNWGLLSVDLRHLYKAYVRPGGMYGSGVWTSSSSEWTSASLLVWETGLPFGAPVIARAASLFVTSRFFLAESPKKWILGDSAKKNLEVTNNDAARAITGAPKGSPVFQTRREADVHSLELVAEAEGTNLFYKIDNLHPDHHLSPLIRPQGRPRLRSRREQQYRADWRSACRRRFQKIPQGACVRHHLREKNETRTLELFFNNKPEDAHHRKATNGRTLQFDRTRSRRDEINLHQLRLNRGPWLQSVAHRSENDICPFCNQAPEDAEHFILIVRTGKTKQKKYWASIRTFRAPRTPNESPIVSRKSREIYSHDIIELVPHEQQ